MKFKLNRFSKSEDVEYKIAEKDSVYAGLTFLFYDLLTGEITPDIRAVMFSILQEKESRTLTIYFYYDGEISDQRLEDYYCLPTEGNYEDYGYPRYWGDFKVEPIRRDYPNSIPEHEVLIYYRKEEKDLVGIQKYQQKMLASPFLDLGGEYFNAHLKLVFQRAFLGLCSPNIRRVTLSWEKKLVFIHFYYDGAISEENHESMKTFMKEFVKHLPEMKCYLRYYQMDYPQPIPFSSLVVYARKEPSTISDSWKSS